MNEWINTAPAVSGKAKMATEEVQGLLMFSLTSYRTAILYLKKSLLKPAKEVNSGKLDTYSNHAVPPILPPPPTSAL